jgi:hypothetical protein
MKNIVKEVGRKSSKKANGFTFKDVYENRKFIADVGHIKLVNFGASFVEFNFILTVLRFHIGKLFTRIKITQGIKREIVVRGLDLTVG